MNKTIKRFLLIAAPALILAACMTPPKPAPAPAPAAPPPTPPVAAVELPPPPAPPSDPYLVKNKAAILQVQKALAAFQKDRGLPENPKLTLGLADKIRSAADAGRVTVTVLAVRPGDFLVYSDGEEEVASAGRDTTWETDQPHALVAIRPAMGGWPAAAKAGLDWALTHALETESRNPIIWSSTGVDQQFEIRTYPSLTQREAGLVGGDPSSCRRFELKSEVPPARYPGIACRDPDGTWYIPHSTVRLARPAAELSTGGKGAGRKKS